MSLDKAIEHGKEKRKPYRGSKAFDKACRNHGSCSHCRSNREYSNRKRRDAANKKLEDFNGGTDEDLQET